MWSTVTGQGGHKVGEKIPRVFRADFTAFAPGAKSRSSGNTHSLCTAGKAEATDTHFVLQVRQRRRRGEADKLRESMIVAELFTVKVVLRPLDLPIHRQADHRLPTDQQQATNTHTHTST